MPSSVTLTPRLIFKEDLSLTTSASQPTSSQYVAGIGPTTLHLIDAVLYSAFGQYANDAAAAAAGVNLGSLYYNTTDSTIHARLS